MPDLSDLVPYYLGQVENLYSKYNSVFHISINYYKLTSCIENSVDPDQLASEEAS